MQIESLKLTGYKCYKNEIEIPFQKLTIFIGENDSGKSSLLQALDLFLSKREANINDFFELDCDSINEFNIEGKFKLNLNSMPEELKEFNVDGYLIVKKTYRKDGTPFKTEVFKNEFVDKNLEIYEQLNAEDLKNLLQTYGLPSQSNQDKRKEVIKNYIESNFSELPKQLNYSEIKFSQIMQYLPIFQYYSSSDYGNPTSLIKKTLDSIYYEQFYDSNNELKDVKFIRLKSKIERKLNKVIEENLLHKIKKYNENVMSIRGEYSIDFARGLDFQGLAIDEGFGYKLIHQKGEGSRKRLFLSILEWDKEVQSEMHNFRSIIRAYDEPDSNLHFDAQRKMFYSISEIINNPKLNIQAMIATHSITMIDRAPASSIVQVIQENGISEIKYLISGGDEDIKNFLDEISEIGGISNSSIFYEKCFLLVEGESEDIALKKMYQKYNHRSLTEDGVVLVNLQSNGAWFNFLKLMKKNKQNCIVMLLDSDTQNPGSGANVTVERLGELGFDSNFLSTNVFFAGVQEFEDIFSDKKIRDTLNILYPRDTKSKWTINHVRKMRTKYPKLSKGFYEETKHFASYNKKIYKKPEFASELCNLLNSKDIGQLQIIVQLFNRIKTIIG